jgi:hypothetical protein
VPEVIHRGTAQRNGFGSRTDLNFVRFFNITKLNAYGNEFVAVKIEPGIHPILGVYLSLPFPSPTPGDDVQSVPFERRAVTAVDRTDLAEWRR